MSSHPLFYFPGDCLVDVFHAFFHLLLLEGLREKKSYATNMHRYIKNKNQYKKY